MLRVARIEAEPRDREAVEEQPEVPWSLGVPERVLVLDTEQRRRVVRDPVLSRCRWRLAASTLVIGCYVLGRSPDSSPGSLVSSGSNRSRTRSDTIPVAAPVAPSTTTSVALCTTARLVSSASSTSPPPPPATATSPSLAHAASRLGRPLSWQGILYHKPSVRSTGSPSWTLRNP